MSLFEPPSEETFCPECGRYRLNCAHMEDDD